MIKMNLNVSILVVVLGVITLLYGKKLQDVQYIETDPIFHSNSTLLIDNGIPWQLHLFDATPPAGSDGVKLCDVNRDGAMDLVSGFEEGNVSRIYINPGLEKAKNYWSYVELPSPNVEDAVLVDLDGDGAIDLVTASEGKDQEIRFHWASVDQMEYNNPESWITETVPSTSKQSAWMFILPCDMDGEYGIDLIIGSKRKPGENGKDKATLGWLKSPVNPRNIEDWEFYSISSAGWIMTIDTVDMDSDGFVDILISDRKFSSQTGVRWLRNPGYKSDSFYDKWESNMIGVTDGEPMFLTMSDLDSDGLEEIIVPDLYRGLTILKRRLGHIKEWDKLIVEYPKWAGSRGKAVSCGEIDGDGRMDIVLSFEEEGKVASIPFLEYSKNGKYSVVLAKYEYEKNINGEWVFYKISGMRGRKFDLVNLIDMDGDGDLDVLTNDENEEEDGLGVVWYENPKK